jgi:RHS repeat-associated protein
MARRCGIRPHSGSTSFDRPNGTGRAWLRAALLALVSAMTTAAAQSTPPEPIPGSDTSSQLDGGKTDSAAPVYVEYEKKLRTDEQVAPLGSDLFGDKVSPYLGQTEFDVVDIDLPGNNALPVQLRRRFSVSMLTKGAVKDSNGGIGNPYGGIGNWDVEVPYIYGTFDLAKKWNPVEPGQTGRCSTPFVPGVKTGFEATDVWSGNKVHLPGQGEFGMMGLDPGSPPVHAQADGQTHKWTTSRFDSFTCKPTSNGAFGEGFVMTTTEGVSYTFDVYVERDYAAVRHGRTALDSAPRLMIFLLASQVTDRHGNWVRYSYNCTSERCAGHPETIQSSDGRKITLSYGPADQLQTAQVTQASPAETRTWRYAYQINSNDSFPQLWTVTLPDNSQWLYTYSNTDYLYVTYSESDASGQECLDFYRSTGGDFTLGVTHPSGSQGTFNFKLTRHKRNLPSYPPNCGNGTYYHPPYVDTFSLATKTITASTNTPLTWSYSYGDGFCQGAGCNSATNRVLLPDGSVADSVFSTMYDATGGLAPAGSKIEGQLLRTDYKATPNGALLRSEIYEYVTGPDVNGQPFPGTAFPSRYGVVYGADDPASGSVRPLKSTQILLRLPNEEGSSANDVTFTRTNDTFDAFARPLKVTSASNLGYTRTRTTAYQDYPAKWVLGLVKSVTDQSTGLVSVLNTYDPGTANLLNVTEFGVSKRSMTYWPSNSTNIGNGWAGTLRTVDDGLNTTSLGMFKRGIPVSVTYADESSQTATISDFGEILSVTDENGLVTQYQYDPVGRLRKIKHPTGDDTTWADTTIDYALAASEMGIAGSHWRRTQTTGNAKKITHYDQLLRPVVTEEYDATSAQTRANTQRYTARAFDYANRETFLSYPSSTFVPTAGVRTLYDAIGRIRTVTQDAEPELGPLVTRTEYFFPFTKKVTDPKGNWTKTKFKAFDTPSEDAPFLITTSAGPSTEIGRDIFDKPLRVERRGDGVAPAQARSYVYDAGQRLCKTIEPESGATIQDYDAAGNVLWSTKGSTLTTNTCDRGSVPQSERTTYDYDGRNRLKRTAFPGGTASIDQTYWPDGALKTTSSNGATWSYDYNRRRLLQSETLTYNGQQFLLEWGYDANGSVRQLMYPDDSIVNFAPNALGQPTQAGNYATGVSYFANGAMKGFTYGNGIVHSLTQNERQLPKRSKDGAATDLSYTYDKNANVQSITDGLSPSIASRTMTYDGLDRLSTANAPAMWGNASFTYDSQDNLRTSKVGIRDCTHGYNAINRLTSISGPNCTAISYGYDARGNVISRGSQAFVFDRADRLATVVGKESYVYDGLGRRVSLARSSGGGLPYQYQVYSKEGQLLFGLDVATGNSTNYVYLNGSLVARNEVAPAVVGPPPPSGLTVAPHPSFDGTYNVTWNEVPGATRYVLGEVANGAAEVTYSLSPLPGAPLLTTWPASGKPNGTYVYRVQACNTVCGEFSGTVTQSVQIRSGSLEIAPIPNDSGIYTVSWQTVAGAASYNLLESGVPLPVYAGASRSWTSASRPDGTYSYQLQTCSGTCGTPGPSASVTVETKIPGRFRASPNPNVVGTPYTLEWDEAANAVTYRLDELVGTTWTPRQNAGGRSITITGKPVGTYPYRVRACRHATNEAYCGQPAELTVRVNAQEIRIPDMPTWLRSDPPTSTDGRYELTWQQPNYTQWYELQEKYCFGDPDEQCEPAWRNLTLLPNNTVARWSPPTPKTGYGKYKYQVRACSSLGCSPWKAYQMDVKLPNVLPEPTHISSIAPNPSRDGNYTVTWPAAARATYYKLRELDAAWTDVPGRISATNWHPATPKPNGFYSYLLAPCNVYGCLPFNPVTTQTEVRVDIPATQPMTPPTGFSVVPGSLNTPRPSPHKFRWNPVAGASSYQLKQEDLTCPQVPDQVIPIAANEPQPYQGVYPELTMCNGQERDPSRFHFSLQACNGNTCSDWTATLTVTVSGVVSRPAGSGTTTYVHTDGLRSPVAETTAAGAVTSRRYEPYGASTSGQPQQGPGYAGHVTDAETGLSYMQQRYYDPMAGRFLSVDPVAASAGGFNRYWYANNNPYKNIDPDGRNPVAIAAAGCAASAACAGVAVAGAGIAVAGIEASSDSISPVTRIAIEGVRLINGVMKNEAKSPGVPKGLVGTKDGAGGEQGKRVNNGPLAPEHGGTGDAEKDFGSLTGGKSAPAPSDKGYPEGTRIGENGISHRPATEKSGPRIDIPANGEKPHETLHYPKK